MISSEILLLPGQDYLMLHMESWEDTIYKSKEIFSWVNRATYPTSGSEGPLCCCGKEQLTKNNLEKKKLLLPHGNSLKRLPAPFLISSLATLLFTSCDSRWDLISQFPWLKWLIINWHYLGDTLVSEGSQGLPSGFPSLERSLQDKRVRVRFFCIWNPSPSHSDS